MSCADVFLPLTLFFLCLRFCRRRFFAEAVFLFGRCAGACNKINGGEYNKEEKRNNGGNGMNKEKTASVSSPRFFLGANTPSGFYSLFDELYEPEDGWRLFIVKGGPGTGKSTLMKKVAAECDRRGWYCERIYCSSDPDSLDGVIIPHKKISICDGTSPHTVEPRFPGVSETTADLGCCRNDVKLRENSSEIIALTLENSREHKKCVGFLKAAAAVSNNIKARLLPAIDGVKLQRFSESLASKELGDASGERGRIKRRFLGALTPFGEVLFYDTFTDMCERRIVLEDTFGLTAGAIMRYMAIEAVGRGYSVIECLSPMSPDGTPLAVMLPEIGLGLIAADRSHACPFDSSRTVNCSRFLNADEVRRHRNRIVFGRKTYDEFIAEALKKLENAKNIHDKLEKYYIEAMDFGKVKRVTDKVAREIFGDEKK